MNSETTQEGQRKTSSIIELCYWCSENPVSDEFNDPFLTGVFGYQYCSDECKQDHINSK
jgi:hypothetical protein